MGNAVAGFGARRTHHHHPTRGRPWVRALGPGLHVAASVALVIVTAQMGAAVPAAASGLHGRHCVAQLGTSDPTMRCFAGMNAAVAAAASSDYYVVSIEWTGSNYTGSSLTWEGPSPCGAYANSSMPRGWNDAIRSVAQYSGCATTLYWDINFGGATRAIDVNASVPDLGDFDAHVSSQKWCPVFSCS